MSTTTYHNYNSQNKQFSRDNRKSMTYGEKVMRNILRKDQLGYRFLRQKPVGPYILDFYCAKPQLCVEVDGPHHKNMKGYDQKRDNYLQRQ